MDAVRLFQAEMLPAVHIEHVSADLHWLVLAFLLSAGKRKLSLVGCVSFEIMRQLGLKQVLVLDAHFRGQGFDTLP